jgi:hypothetical protein
MADDATYIASAAAKLAELGNRGEWIFSGCN